MPRAVTPPYAYTLPAVYLAIPGTTILVDQHNTPLEDIATTLNTATPIQYGGTAAATVAGAQANLGITASDQTTYPTATGTGDALVVTNTTPILALANRVPGSFKASAANTTAATVNVDGLGAKAIRKISGGTDVALVAGDISAGGLYLLNYSTSANSAAGAWVMSPSPLGNGYYYSTDAGATAGPIIKDYRNSVSPAVADVMGQSLHDGNNSTPAEVTYAKEETVILDPTASSEDARRDHYAMVAGSLTRIMSVGPNLDLAAVGQIKFPATQNPSSDPNTLDDYEEGTFTASVFQSSQLTVTTTAATYTKIGNQVHLESISSITSSGSAGVIIVMNGAPLSAAIVGTSFSVIGTYQFLKNGVAYYVGSAIWIALLAIAGQTNNTGTQIGNSPSLTAVSGDVLSVCVNYRA